MPLPLDHGYITFNTNPVTGSSADTWTETVQNAAMNDNEPFGAGIAEAWPLNVSNPSNPQTPWTNIVPGMDMRIRDINEFMNQVDTDLIYMYTNVSQNLTDSILEREFTVTNENLGQPQTIYDKYEDVVEGISYGI